MQADPRGSQKFFEKVLTEILKKFNLKPKFYLATSGALVFLTAPAETEELANGISLGILAKGPTEGPAARFATQEPAETKLETKRGDENAYRKEVEHVEQNTGQKNDMK